MSTSSDDSFEARRQSERALAERPLSNQIQPQADGPRSQAPRHLKWWDVAALVVNKMVGSGIFVSPALVMGYTGNRGLTLGLWILGFVYTTLSMALYLELARWYGYNGGELIYLDVLRKRCPRLLLYTWYTFYFVLLYTTCTNSLQFANQVLRAADVDNLTETWNPDRRLLGTLAFVITTGVCLLLYFDSQTSRKVNAILAAAKVALLVAVFGAGCFYMARNEHEWSGWSQHIQDIDVPPFGWAQALMVVFLTFHGWENATFVAGDVGQYPVLRDGVVVGVVIVGTLYIMIVVVFCSVFPATPHPGVLRSDFDDYMALFFGGSNRSKQASAILIALSIVGSMISISYACIRVKQIIGWVNILPFSELWRRTDLSRKMDDLYPLTQENKYRIAAISRRGTPEGGIILHYIVSIVQIGVSSTIKDLKLAIGLQSSAVIYGHFFFESILGIAYALSLPQDPADVRGPEWKGTPPPDWYKRVYGRQFLGASAALASLFIVFIQLMPFDNMKRWYLAVILGLAGFAVVYWFLFVWSSPRWTKADNWGLRFITQQHSGKDDEQNPWRTCTRCPDDNSVHRHREHGYLDYNFVEFTDDKKGTLFRIIAGGLGDKPEAVIKDELEVPMQADHSRANSAHGRIGVS